MQDKEFVSAIKKKEVRVSVIVPVYNAQDYLQRCLESIVFQTMSDIEVIIINDGSTDETNKVIDKFLTDKRVIYVKQENKGVNSARNKGLTLAKGEYISFVDATDYIENDFLEKLYKISVKNDADISASSIIRGHETYEKWRVNYTKSEVITDRDECFKALRFPRQLYIWNKLYKKSFLDEFEYKFNENLHYGDIMPTVNALLNCKKLCLTTDANYCYMKNDKKQKIDKCEKQKIEKDKYKNQKTAIKKIIRNEVKIPRRDYFINKFEFRLFDVPIFKLKEDILAKSEVLLLFNLIPVFYIKKCIFSKVRLLYRKLKGKLWIRPNK